MKKYLSILLIALSISSFAQPIVEEKPYIEINGTAEKEIVPDEIFISITLLERTEGKEIITVEKQEASLKKGLSQIGIDLKTLYVSDANSDYGKIKWRKKDAIGQMTYELKVADGETVGKVFQKLDELKIENASISKVSHSKIEEFKKEVHISAIKAAKDKATYLLSAIGEEAGKPLIIRENYSDFYPQYKQRNMMLYETSNYAMDAAPEQEVLDFKKIKISASVYVKFAIK